MREKSEKKVYSLVQTSWESVSSEVICFSSRKSVLSGHYMICRTRQGLVLSLDMSQEPRVFPGVWRHKGWFEVPNKSLSSEDFGGAFSNQKILGLQGVILEVIVTPRVHCEKTCTTTWLLLTEAITSLHC